MQIEWLIPAGILLDLLLGWRVMRFLWPKVKPWLLALLRRMAGDE